MLPLRERALSKELLPIVKVKLVYEGLATPCWVNLETPSMYKVARPPADWEMVYWCQLVSGVTPVTVVLAPFFQSTKAPF